jgi:signal peptidase I
MTSPEENVISDPAPPGEAVAEPPESAPVTPAAVTAEPESAPAPAPPQSPQGGETLTQSLLSIIVIVLFVITFVVQAFQIPSESMEKTLLIGDYLLVDKVHFGRGGISSWLLPYKPLKHGDIVVFHYPVDPSQHFVKRVIGLPGDHIRLRDKVVYLNDAPLDENYAVFVQEDHDSYRDNFPAARDLSGQVDMQWRSDLRRYLHNGELVVPPDQYFVMGDNRDHSLDSRYWGFVPRGNIVGRPLVIYLSVRSHPDDTDAAGGSNDKLFSSGHLLTHIWQFARWGRMFHLVR